ncbi:MAG: discoidin domain-containing protein [Candidatus Azobacteroides sp.]|nr:discoidin domain-containing protein [Candidatus Azobacteroides sp.]
MMRKQTLKNFVFILLFLLFLFSCRNQSNLDRALELAGKNRVELEKVLAHYSHNPKDRLKLKAARFLIENMDSYSSRFSPELTVYYHTLDSIFSMNDRLDAISKEQDSLLTKMKKPNSFYLKSIPDLQQVSAEFLIDNIDKAFEAWQSPFAKDLNFDDFCELLLPYKADPIDYPDFWRSDYYHAFYPYVKFALDTICLLDSGWVLQYPHIELTGTNYLSLPDRLFDAIPAFTLCCWVTTSEYKPQSCVFSLGKNTHNQVCFVPYTKDGMSQFRITTEKPSWGDSLKTTPLPLARRSHIAITYFQNCVTFYIDGVLEKRLKGPLTNKDLIRNFIGKSQDEAAPYFKGEIDSFRIYNRELNHTEISALAGKNGLPDRRDRLIDAVRGIRNLYYADIMLQSYLLGGCHPSQYVNLKTGPCYDYTVLSTYIFRSLGIPTGIDRIPQWATRSLGHDWSALYTGKNRMEDYSFGAEWDTIGYHFHSYQILKDRAAKIFRQTFAKQPNSLAMQNEKGEVIPSAFRDPHIKDVTNFYLDCKDITVSFTQAPPPKRKYAYLCNFNNQNWVPVQWGKIKGHKAAFTKMGKDIAYLPAYYDQDGLHPAADPFILTQEGEIKTLTPNHSKTQTMILKRKYKTGNVPKKGELLVGGRFQAANKPDFSDSLTVYVVNEIPEICYNSVNIAFKKPCRYFRFLSAPDSRGGQISEIEIYSEQGLKLFGRVIGNKHCSAGWEAGNAFDGDPLTSYQCESGEQGWVGLDFGKPVNIAYFRYLPRNDDNFIKEGEEYELFYWENYQWNSLGKQIGASKQYLDYANAPTHALFWLRNLSKGKEERIFTYENGEQVWW